MADIKIKDVIPQKVDLAYDSRQWIVRRWGGVNTKTGLDVWKPTKFTTTRLTTFRALMQVGVPKQAAFDAVQDLPSTHAEFISDKL